MNERKCQWWCGTRERIAHDEGTGDYLGPWYCTDDCAFRGRQMNPLPVEPDSDATGHAAGSPETGAHGTEDPPLEHDARDDGSGDGRDEP